MVYTLGLGPSALKSVQVQVLSPALDYIIFRPIV